MTYGSGHPQSSSAAVPGKCLPVPVPILQEGQDPRIRRGFQLINQLIERSNLPLPDALLGLVGTATSVSGSDHVHPFPANMIISGTLTVNILAAYAEDNTIDIESGDSLNIVSGGLLFADAAGLTATSLTLGTVNLSLGTTNVLDLASGDSFNIVSGGLQFGGVDTGLSNLATAEVSQLANINSVTLSNTQWGYLGSQDQAVATSNTPSFAGVSLTGNLALAANSITGTSVDINNFELQQLSNIGAVTINGTQWGYVGAMNQGVGTGDTVTFANIILADGGTVGQAAGPLLTFNDTGNTLAISGCNVTVTGTVDGRDISVDGTQLDANVTAIGLNTAASHAEAHNMASHSDTTITGAETETLSNNSMADALHRHSELSASDGSQDAVVNVDSDGILYADAGPLGIDILYGGIIGTHLTVGDNLSVGGTLLIGTTEIAEVEAAKTIKIGTEAEIGQLPTDANFAMFGNADLDHTVLGNYALIHRNTGLTILNASTGQRIDFRIQNVAKGRIDTSVMRMEVPLKIKEAAAAVADTTAYGQFWVKDDAPNTAWFTDDIGVDRELALQGDSAWVLTPSATGTQCIIDIIPSAALSGAVTWDGLCIEGIVLDPENVGATVRAITIDLTGVSLENDPILRGIKVDMPASYTDEEEISAFQATGNGMSLHLLETEGRGIFLNGPGRIEQNYDAVGITADDILIAHTVTIDGNDAGGGEVHCFEADVINQGSVSVSALATFTGVDVIHQHIGTPAALGKAWENDSGFTDRTAAFNASGTNVTLFDNDSFEVYVGSATKFDEIEVALITASSKNIIAVFEFWSGAVWTPFGPSDGTDGFQQSGSIHFESAALSGWVTTTVNGEGDGPWYYIRITRTRGGAIATPPIEETIQVEATDVFEWDKNGDISAHKIVVPTSTPASAGATGVAGTITWDSSYIYVCVATDTWERAGLASW